MLLQEQKLKRKGTLRIKVVVSDMGGAIIYNRAFRINGFATVVSCRGLFLKKLREADVLRHFVYH